MWGGVFLSCMYKLFVESCCNFDVGSFFFVVEGDCSVWLLSWRVVWKWVYGVPEYVCVVFVIPVLIQFSFSDVWLVFWYFSWWFLRWDVFIYVSSGILWSEEVPSVDFVSDRFWEYFDFFVLIFAFWDVVFVCIEYCICDNLVYCVYVCDWLCVWYDVFYFISVFCPVGFTVVGVRLSLLLKSFVVGFGVDLQVNR